MLGRLQMTVDECIDVYVLLSDRIFQKRRHRVTIKGHVQGRFDSDELEKAIKEIVVKGLGRERTVAGLSRRKVQSVSADHLSRQLKDILTGER